MASGHGLHCGFGSLSRSAVGAKGSTFHQDIQELCRQLQPGSLAGMLECLLL